MTIKNITDDHLCSKDIDGRLLFTRFANNLLFCILGPMNEDEVKDDEEFEDVSFVESTEDGDVLPTKDIVKKLREDLKKARTDKDEYLIGWQRAKADYVNLQKEMDQVRKTTALLTKERMADSLLPVLDSFDMAFSNKEVWEKVDANWRTGIEYIYSQFKTRLAESGIEQINAVGVPFDPNLHESIESVPTDDKSKDHTVEKVLQAGYKMGEKIIRPARVTVYEFR
ncbi:MAG TPA: nucleotide exchange factor GrpE [Cyclobacteriaceae bacterium]|jgi:molecular chaperone GrpE|nr:nucleotide exchange factor GrpE [Cyclobacteriaceae bacterium]